MLSNVKRHYLLSWLHLRIGMSALSRLLSEREALSDLSVLLLNIGKVSTKQKLIFLLDMRVL